MKENQNKFPRSIVDIKFSGNRAYILKEFNITSADVEEQLKNIKYTGQGRKRSKMTENQKFPPFALAFFNLLFRLQKVPDEMELFSFYKECFLKKTEQGLIFCQYENNKFLVDLEAFKGRLFRTYPSLIRDYHFFLKCNESKYFDKVIYSLRQDYYDGIDITVTSEHIEKNVSLHTKTQRGRLFKTKKYSRHDYKDKNEIVLEIDLEQSKKVSDFYLYPDEVVEALIQKVEEEKSTYLST